MSLVFKSIPVIPVANPFNIKGIPDDYLLACTSDSCFSRGVFDRIVEDFRAISDSENDVCVADTILFVSPAITEKIKLNPSLAPLRY